MPLAGPATVQDGFTRFLEADLGKDLLRFTTAGSVDDGKSTLIGRLLHDSQAVYEDQLATVRKSRVNRSGKSLDFALLTDGLRAEREQGITIDVAYRYFQTARRKFIIADTPGHEEYTRNMATGASTADLAVILMDATKGVLPQTRRHAYISALLGVRHVVAAVNKLDLLGYRQDVFVRLERDFLALTAQLGIANVRCIPISALEGDNVVARSTRTPWYGGPSLMEYLEEVPVAVLDDGGALRFPVQYVLRPHGRFRGFAGQVAGGTLRAGERVVALPSGRETRVRAVVTYDGELPEATAPQSVTVTLEDEIDLSRGDMLVSPHDLPQVAARFAANVVWMDAQPFEEGGSYLIKHAGRVLRAHARRIRHRVDIHTFAHLPARQIAMNEIAEIELEASKPLYFDAYNRNRTTGSFIVIDPLTNATLGAGMILGAIQGADSSTVQDEKPRVVASAIEMQERAARHGHAPGVLLLEGSASAISHTERALFGRGFEALLVDLRGLGQQALRAAVELAIHAGLLAIVPSDGLTKQQLDLLAEIAGTRLLRVAAALGDEGHESIVARAIAAAEALRRGAPGESTSEGADV